MFEGALSFSPDDRTLAFTAWSDSSVYIRNFVHGRFVDTLKKSIGELCYLCFSPTGRNRRAQQGRDEKTFTYDVSARVIIDSLEGTAGPVIYNDHGDFLATGNFGWNAEIWRCRVRSKPMVLKGYILPYYTFLWRPTGKEIFFGADRFLVRFDLENFPSYTYPAGIREKALMH